MNKFGVAFLLMFVVAFLLIADSDSLEILNSRRRRRRTLQSTIHKVDTRSVDFRNDVLPDVQKGTPNNMRALFEEEVEDGQDK
ncbi:hypothetical protein ABFA07_002073 [Porites harrisoni]